MGSVSDYDHLGTVSNQYFLRKKLIILLYPVMTPIYDQ